MRTLNTRSWVLSAVAAALCATPALAQKVGPPAKATNPNRAAARGAGNTSGIAADPNGTGIGSNVGGAQNGNFDAILVSLVSMTEQNQMRLAQLGGTQSQRPLVQQYATTIIQQDQQFVQLLQQFAGGTAGTNGGFNTNPLNNPQQAPTGGGVGTPAVTNPTATVPATGAVTAPGALPNAQAAGTNPNLVNPGATNNGINNGGIGVGNVGANNLGTNNLGANNLGNNNLGANNLGGLPDITNLMSELQAIGADFDLTYLGIQLAGELDAAATISALSRVASPNLAQALQQGAQLHQQQIQQGIAVLRQVVGQDVGTTGAIPRRNTISSRGNQ